MSLDAVVEKVARPRMTQRARLAAPFKPSLIHKPAPGQHGDYVSHDAVTQKLLAVVGPFDLDVVELIRDNEGRVDGCLVRLTCEIDGLRVSVTEAGECDNADVKKTNGERAKHAVSDAIKRCAMRLGVGLHLWADDYFLYEYLRPQGACAECGTIKTEGRPYDPDGPAGEPM